jgi:hypothetical protein
MRLPFLRTKSAAPVAGPRIPSWATPLVDESGSYAGQVQAAFLANPVAARAIRMVTESAGGAPVVSAPGDHPALALLHSCGFGASGPGLLETVAGHMLLHGNAYVDVAVGADGLPAALFALRPERVNIEVDGEGWPAAHVYRAGGAVRRYPVGANGGLLHIRSFHPTDDHHGAGASAGWRRAGVMLSLDDGASYEPVGLLPAPVAMGRAVSILPAAVPAGWDRFGQVEVEVLADSMWLESCSESAVLAGGNLALIGDEIFQFATAEALSNRRFRLSGLLRGRRGTELAVATHVVDERFVLLDQGAMLAVPLALERQGQSVLLRPTGVGDAAAVPVAATLDGAGIRPLLPVHLSWRRQAGQLHLSWIAQSRAGFGWPDLADVPIGESRLAFRAVLRDPAGIVAEAELNGPSWILADRAGPLWLDVAQVGTTMGPVAALLISSTGV